MKNKTKLLIENIGCLYGIEEKPHLLKKGGAMSLVNSQKDAYILCEDGRISDYGPMDQLTYPEGDYNLIDANQGHVLPTWCDSHTHIVYATSREGEFRDRIKGLSYEEISQNGGGILNSAKKLQNTNEDDLFQSALERLQEVIRFGTGAIEIKSGYGLTVESEIKMLRVIKRLKSISPIPIKATFLGAHAFPMEYRDNHDAYIDLIINEMLPKIHEDKLADYIDVFCDKGFFNVEETSKILEAGATYGLKAKIHANELGRTGGVQVGIAHNAISVDHLEETGQEEIDALLGSSTIPTLLPSTSFFLNIPYGPARRMIHAGLGICLASDYNPGSTPSGKIPFLLSLACLKMKLLPEEAFNAVTYNGAFAMELQTELGSITKGKIANLIITKPIKNFSVIPYYFGGDHIAKNILNGQVWTDFD